MIGRRKSLSSSYAVVTSINRPDSDDKVLTVEDIVVLDYLIVKSMTDW